MRRMFGKTGVFCDGFMFGMVTENTLYLRADDDNRADFKEAQSARRPLRDYVRDKYKFAEKRAENEKKPRRSRRASSPAAAWPSCAPAARSTRSS